MSTSATSANVVPPVVISESPGGLTRRAIVANVVTKPGHPEQSLHVKFIHERRANRNKPWEPVESLNLQKLRAEEWVQLEFDSADTLTLITRLQQLYAASVGGPVPGVNDWKVVRPGTLVIEGEQADLVKSLLQDYGNEQFFELLRNMQPGLAEWVAQKQRYEQRRTAVEEFENQLGVGRWHEPDWETFFKSNTWMLGFGLRYQFLNLEKAQPNYGGGGVSGRGDVKGDILASTKGAEKFTVLVELKLPNADLVLESSYRNRVYDLGKDVIGGVAQVQAQCEQWPRTERDRANKDVDARTILPKGLLIVGNLATLAGNDDRVETFERFRRNLTNPEIVTFDEVLERAKAVLDETPVG